MDNIAITEPGADAALPAARRPSMLALLRRPLLPEDRRAAWASALVMLPQAISFSVLAGLPPEMGIYSSVLPVIVASLLGPSAQLLSGPNTAVAVMISVALLPLGVPGSDDYLALATMLTVMVGLVQVVAALSGVGRLLALLPRFTSAGLNIGIGLIMLSCQIAPALGLLNSRAFPSWEAGWVYAQRWADVNPWALVVTAVTILAAQLSGRLFRTRVSPLVVAMLFGMLVGWALDLGVGAEATGLERIGHLHLQFELLQWPGFHADELYVIKQLALSAVGIALVGSLQSIIILQATYPGADHRDCRRELLAQAASNLTASVSGGFACSGSFNRTAAHVEAGAVTRKAAVLSSLILLVFAFVAAPVFAYMPRAAIAGTLMLVGWGMVRSGWRSALREAPTGRNAALFLGLAVPLAGIEATLGLAILLAVLLPVIKFSHRPQPS